MIDIATLPSVPLANRRQLPHTPGVYVVIGATGNALYVGQSASILLRWQNHRLLRDGLKDVRIAWSVTTDVETARILEGQLIRDLNPPLNATPNSASHVPPAHLNGDEELVLVADAARETGYSAEWLRTLIDKGKARGKRVGRYYVMPRAEVDRLKREPRSGRGRPRKPARP